MGGVSSGSEDRETEANVVCYTAFDSMYKSAQGFSLIELLVVISIIGLLGTFAVFQISGTRERARVAKASSFDGMVQRNIGAFLVGRYDLEEGTGGNGAVVADSSGLNNHGTIVGAGTSWSSSVYDKKASSYALAFSGADYFSPARGFGIANSNFTITEWVKTTSAQTQMYNVTNAGSSNGYRFGLWSGRVAFLVGNTVNGYTESQCGSLVLNDGKWHHIAGVFDRTGGKFSCYADGVKLQDIAIGSYPGMSDVVARIGTMSNAFIGSLDNVRIYSATLNGSGIEAIYQEERKMFAGRDE